MDIRQRKRALRREMVARLLALDPADRRRQEADLLARFPTLPGLDRAGTVLLYATAFPEEIPTGPMLRLIWERGQRLVCPRVNRPARRLVLHAIADPADLVPGTLGIPEPRPECPEVAPEAIDWALVPGLAFNAAGYRLGRGAGCYDRLLPQLRPDAPRWALAFDPQWVEDLPVEPHDQPLDGIASPRQTIIRGPSIRDIF
ncbi:MAG: 5-formyltetrahydrofolate cyclo-ligase [Isosphaeraceae bacterium]|nr:5-formyltetrahydrofolate cyclo-ligase [Isosphaeraceae bacterium]